MIGKRILALVAGVAMVAMVGCADGEESSEVTDTEIVTEPGTETVEVEVPTTDTLMVETTTETTVDVDTTEIEGDADVE